MDVGQLILQGLANLFYIALVLAAAMAPPYLILRGELRRLRDPAYLKASGVFIRTLSALDAVADVIGRYNGVDIYRFVVFKGMRYDYDRILPKGLPRVVREKELFMEPGVIYVTS